MNIDKIIEKCKSGELVVEYYGPSYTGGENGIYVYSSFNDDDEYGYFILPYDDIPENEWFISSVPFGFQSISTEDLNRFKELIKTN